MAGREWPMTSINRANQPRKSSRVAHARIWESMISVGSIRPLADLSRSAPYSYAASVALPPRSLTVTARRKQRNPMHPTNPRRRRCNQRRTSNEMEITSRDRKGAGCGPAVLRPTSRDRKGAGCGPNTPRPTHTTNHEIIVISSFTHNSMTSPCSSLIYRIVSRKPCGVFIYRVLP